MRVIKRRLLIMKRVNLFILFFLVFLVIDSWAHPPSDITLEYDKERKILKILLKHVTEDIQEHRIRKIIVTKNNEEPLKFYYSSQTSPKEFIQEISLEAQSGDTIVVKAICSQAGNKEETLLVP